MSSYKNKVRAEIHRIRQMYLADYGWEGRCEAAFDCLFDLAEKADREIADLKRKPPEPVIPKPDIPAPETHDPDIEGWDFNEYRDYDRVFRAWSSSIAHGYFYKGCKRSGGSQGRRALYSTLERALEGLLARYEEQHRQRCGSARKLVKELSNETVRP